MRKAVSDQDRVWTARWLLQASSSNASPVGKLISKPCIRDRAGILELAPTVSECAASRAAAGLGARRSATFALVATSRFSGGDVCAISIRVRADIRAGTASASSVRHGQAPNPALAAADAAPLASERQRRCAWPRSASC